MLAWDWQGAQIVIEHCDAAVSGRDFEKGFMPLTEELEVLAKFSDSPSIGMTINWARSAIEGRSADTPIEHLVVLQEAGLLNGVIFSGVSAQDTAYGAWKDTHMPFARSFDVDNYEQNSLLSYKNLHGALSVINLDALNYLGIKLLSMPIDESILQRRVGVNQDALYILEKVLQEVSSE